MSVTRPVRETDELGTTFDLSATGHRCFLCGALLQNPAVAWYGADGQHVFWHAACLIAWMPKVMRDALEIHYAGHPCAGRANNREVSS